MLNVYRSQLIKLISESGKQFEIFTTWENASKSQRNGLFVENEHSIHSWFFIKNDNEIWKLAYNSSDGGCWNSEGPLVYGYKTKYTQEIRDHIKKMYTYKNQESLNNSSYRKLKYREM